MAQWLRLQAPNTGAPGSIPVQGARSHVLQLKACMPQLRKSYPVHSSEGFPASSVGKKSTCNAGDPGSIPGSRRSAGEGIVYPLQYSWTSLVVQLVKNPPAMQETSVQSLGWEDPLEKGMVPHSSVLAWRIVHGVTKSWTRPEQLSISHSTEDPTCCT